MKQKIIQSGGVTIVIVPPEISQEENERRWADFLTTLDSIFGGEHSLVKEGA
jgi:hypothetical protein